MGGLESEVSALQMELEASQAENNRLRSLLAKSNLPCVYCDLPAEDWAKCEHGFPGCARADDAN